MDAAPPLRELKARAQRLKPVIHVGADGLDPGLLAALDEALRIHGLVKVRLGGEWKTRRREASESLASASGARIIQQVGHTVVLHRADGRPDHNSASSGAG